MLKHLSVVILACLFLYGCSDVTVEESQPVTTAKSAPSATTDIQSSAVAVSVMDIPSSTMTEYPSATAPEEKLPTVPEAVMEFASFVVEDIIRPNFREYGLSSNLGIASISCAIPQYGYADKELKKVELERYLIFLNDEAAQFITVSADGGMQSDSGESYPAITKFLAQNQRVCLVSAGAKGFLKSPEDAIQIADYSNMVPYDGPDVTAADIIGIKNDDLIYVPLDTTVLKEYRTIVE